MKLLVLAWGLLIPTLCVAQFGSTTVCLWKGNRLAAFTPTYDDMPGSGFFSLKDGFAPLHERYQMKGAAAIVPQAQWTNGQWFPKGFGWPDLKRIFDRGWIEPISHTLTHHSLPTLTTEEIDRELDASNRIIFQNTGYRIETMAYPYGNFDERVEKEAAKYYVSSRAFDGVSPNSPEMRDYQAIHSAAIVGRTTSQETDEWVETALREHGWLVTTVHALKEYNDGWEPVPTSLIDHQLHYARAKMDAGSLWNETYTHVAKYLRERHASTVRVLSASQRQIEISLTLSSDLAPSTYDYPLTLQTEVPAAWNRVSVTQGNIRTVIEAKEERGHRTVVFDAVPGGASIWLIPTI